MRNSRLLIGLLLGLPLGLPLGSACNGGPSQPQDPPTLTITSPQRSLIQSAAGTITVTGTVTPNAEGTPIQSVKVNDVAANVGSDGAFSIDVQVQEGATLIHTVAIDAGTNQVTDTRSVEAGANQAFGSMIQNAVTAAISKEAFAKMASAAGPIVTGMNMQPLLAPMQPMVTAGGGCLSGQLYVENLTTTKATMALVPVAGGMTFAIELDGLDVPGHMTFTAACIGGSDSTDVKATSVLVAGTLLVAPDGHGGFTTALQNPTVNISGLDISAGGVPGAILDILPLDSALEAIAPIAANMFAGPIVNKALGALGGPKTLDLLGTQMTVNVVPSKIDFTSDAGVLGLDMSMVIGSSPSGKGFTLVTDGSPAMNAGVGMELGLADNLANDLIAQAVSLNLLNLSMATVGGTFDTTALAMTSPPMISANGSDGKLALVLPDVTATFLYQGTPVAQAALNAEIELGVAPSQNGLGVAIQLGTPTIDVDVLPTIANETHYSSGDLSSAVTIPLQAEIATFGVLLGDIPLPSLGGIQLSGLSVAADSGYVMVTAQSLN